jgi:hypothetical protein
VIHLAGHRSVRLFLQMYDGLTGLGRRAKRTSGCRCWHLAVEKGIYISADRPLICQKLAVVGEADLQQLLHQIKLKNSGGLAHVKITSPAMKEAFNKVMGRHLWVTYFARHLIVIVDQARQMLREQLQITRTQGHHC